MEPHSNSLFACNKNGAERNILKVDFLSVETTNRRQGGGGADVID